MEQGFLVDAFKQYKATTLGQLAPIFEIERADLIFDSFLVLKDFDWQFPKALFDQSTVECQCDGRLLGRGQHQKLPLDVRSVESLKLWLGPVKSDELQARSEAGV